MTPLLVGGLGTTELLLILAVVVLLFGASKLPELARGSGRALRIFKAETKGLADDDDDEATKTAEQREIEARQQAVRDAEKLIAEDKQRQEQAARATDQTRDAGA